jgi:hypothetical protein
MLLDSDAPIPQNSLDSLPLEDQEWNDYSAGRVLVSGIVARTDARCAAPASSFSQFGPLVQQAVADSLDSAQTNLSMQTQQTQQAIDLASSTGATIADDEMAAAPVAVPLGSTSTTTGGAASPASSGQSVYTPAQIAQATVSPKNWPDTLTFKGRTPRLLSRSKTGILIGGGSGTAASGDTRARARTPAAVGEFPGARWGRSGGSSPGRCGGIGGNPGGKLLLFAGLGLIAAGLLDSARRK